MFVDRELELNFLETRWKSDKAELIIIYGRRGIGKTELVKRFIKGKKAYYFFVTGEEINTLLQSFMKQLGGRYSKLYVKSLREFYEIIADLSMDERVIFVFDEFQRLSDVYKGALSLLQGIWDSKLVSSKIFLILVGSAVSVMERISKSYESPLYGRSTGILELRELDYWSTRLFFPNYNEEEKLFIYGILGGVPSYLKLFDDTKPVEENITNQILTRGSRLYDEPEILLLQETREPAVYMSILRAIASGYTKLSEISDTSGLERSKLSKYLNVLIERLKLVSREKPVMEKGRGRYRITNNFVEFWFRYILPNKSLLEIGKISDILKQIMSERNIYIARKFEDVAKQFLNRINGGHINGIEIRFNLIGKWWKREKEIDLIAINEKQKHVYFIECKYTDKPIKRNTLTKLIAKSEEFKWKKNERKETFIIFSKNGFEFEPDEDTILVDLKAMVETAKNNFRIIVLN